MNTKTNNGNKSVAVKPTKANGNGKAKAPAKKKLVKKVAKPTKAKGKAKVAHGPEHGKRRFLFEQPLSHIVHRLGKLGWKPSAAYNAIKRTKGNDKVSPKATSSQIYSGRNRKPTDKQLGTINAKNLAMLKRLSLVGVEA